MSTREELLALIDRELVIPDYARGNPNVTRGTIHLYDTSNASELLTYPKPFTHIGWFGNTMDELIDQISHHHERSARWLVLELDELDPNSEYPFAWWAPRRYKYFVRYFTVHEYGTTY
jgi:hypothetical protein